MNLKSQIANLRSVPSGFTLIELILVMALLLTVVSVSVPSLARFFRGRGLDSEAYRLLALARYGQSRAVAEGIPMLLWLDEEQGRYGLQAEFTYAEEDELARSFKIDDEVMLEIAPPVGNPIGTRTAVPVSTTPEPFSRDLTFVRFTPDGFIAATSPEWVRLRERRETDRGADTGLWVALSQNRLSYELRTEEPPLVAR